MAHSKLRKEYHCRKDQVEQEVQGEGEHTQTHAYTAHMPTAANASGGVSCKNCHPPSEGAEINEHTTLRFCPLISLLHCSR